MNFPKRTRSPRKIKVSTTLDKEIYEWIKKQTTLSEWIETMARDFASKGFMPEDVIDVQRRVKFFSQKVIDLQADVKVLQQENTQLKLRQNHIKRTIKRKKT